MLRLRRDRLGGAFASLLRNIDIHHLQVRQRVAKDRALLVTQVAARFFPNHLQLIDEHFRQLEIDFAFAGLRIWDLPEKKRGVLRVHHDKFDEALGKLAALCAGLDFSHL